MTTMKRANTNAALTVPEIGPVTVKEGQTYDVDESPWSELAAEHPWVFEGPDDVVEEATSNPGTKRNTRRTSER